MKSPLVFTLSLLSCITAMQAGFAQNEDDDAKIFRPRRLAMGPVLRPSVPTPNTPSASPPTTVTPMRGPAAPNIPGNEPLFVPQQSPSESNPVSQPKTPGSTQPPDTSAPVQGTVRFSTGQPPADQSQQEGLSLSQALDEALIKGPRAAAIRAQLPIAKAGIAQAAISPNPVLFYDNGFIAEATERRGTSFSWDAPWKLAFRVIAAKRLYDQTKIDLMTTLWQLRADTRRAYTEAIVAQETQTTLSDLFGLTQRLLEVSSKRFQAGDVPELDLLRARLATSQAQIDLGVGAQRVIRARQQLNVIMGRVVQQPIAVPHLPAFIGAKPSAFQMKAVKRGILPDYTRTVPPLTYFLGLAQENRLELKSLAQQLKVNQANFRTAVANVMPNPSVTYGSSKSANLPTGPKLAGNFLTLNIETPVSNLNQGELSRLKTTGRQLNYQMAAQKNQVQADVVTAYNNLIAARDRIRVYQEHVLSDSNEVARLSRRSYEVGQSDINSTLLAQQANIQIRSQYLDAITNYQQAYTDLEQACGMPID